MVFEIKKSVEKFAVVSNEWIYYIRLATLIMTTL